MTGFIERVRKITPVSMIESILFTNQDPSKVSLNDMAIYHKIHCGIEITRQAISKRFSKAATEFVKLLLAHLLKSNLSVDPEIFTNSNFNRILIKDSSSNQLPENLKDKYPGSGGASSKASVRIQFEYDLKNQEVLELSPSAFNEQDIKNAKETLCNIKKDDLVIRDLGYVSTEVLYGIEEKKAWYISRLGNNYDVYEKQTGEKIDFNKLEQFMRKHKICTVDKEVFVGANKYPTRLVIEIVPDPVKAERIRKAKKKSVRKGTKISEKSRARFGLNLFLTNCTQTMISAPEIRKIYGIRWQVELIFKAWKQNIQFHKIKKMDIHRYEFLLYTKLVMVLLTWRLHQSVDTYMFWKDRQRISVLKLYKTINQLNEQVRGIIRGNKDSIIKLTEYMLDIGKNYLLHDDRKNRINWRNVQNI